MDKPINSSGLPKPKLNPKKLELFFVTHLNRLYCAKSHLAERLPEIELQAHFNDLKHAIKETLQDAEKQIARMDEIYILLKTSHSFARCDGLVGMIEEAYSAIHEQNNDYETRNLTILFYLQNIESIEMSSFQALKMLALSLKNKQISQLLLENFDNAKEDRKLLVLITKNIFPHKFHNVIGI